MTKAARKAVEPRLLSREQAATYCGVSVPTLMSECPVTPVKIRSRVLYDRLRLDAWLDRLQEPDAILDPRVGLIERLRHAHAHQGD